MKKVLLAAFTALAIVVAVPASTFAATGTPPQTIVTGYVKAGGTGVGGARVMASCGSVNGVDSATDSDGGYYIALNGDECPAGEPISVTATKGGASGSNDGTAGQVTTKLNVALVDVNVALPEMGTIVGGMAAIGAGGAFLMVRKRQQQQAERV